MTDLSPPAVRSRRYRARRRAGVVVAPVEVDAAALDALQEYAFLGGEADVDDRDKVSEAIQLLLFVLTERAIEIDYDHFD